MNRAQRRKDSGKNKRGIHRPDKQLLLVYGTQMWKQYPQTIVTKSGEVKTIVHTQFVR